MKINQLKMIIREVVREEIQLGLKEIIGEINQPSQIMTGATGEVRRNTKPPKQKKQNFSSNSVLNDVLNETANDGWETMGETKYTSDRMGELLGDKKQNVSPNDPMSQFLNKDYSDVLKKVEEKDKRKHGR